MRLHANAFAHLAALGTVFLAALLLGGCSALQKDGQGAVKLLQLPPISEQAMGEYHPGKFVWHDLLTPDPIAAQAFYGGLLGWSFRKLDDYIEIYNGEHKIGGIMPIPDRGEPKHSAHWLPAMSVMDVQEAARQTRKLGGTVINGPISLGNRGEGVLVSDPGGAHLLLLHAAGGDPEDREPSIGDWLWNEDWTLDSQPLTLFYNEIGQYEDLLQEEGYVVFINEGHWRAGLRVIEQKAYAGRWVPVIRVEDPATLLDKVEKLGGKVWLRPGEADASEDTALISDSRGALVILQRWSFSSEGEAR